MSKIDETAFAQMVSRAGIKPELESTARKFVTEYEAAKCADQPVELSFDPEALVILACDIAFEVTEASRVGKPAIAAVAQKLRPYLRQTERESVDVVALKEQNRIMRDVLVMLSKRQIATWYSAVSAVPSDGYYAGWDDAEYAVRKALQGVDWGRG